MTKSTRARKTDPQSSHDAARKASNKAVTDRAKVRKALEKKPRQTGRELEKALKYTLDYHTIMRRVGEVAVKGERRPCKTGLPSVDVHEYYLA